MSGTAPIPQAPAPSASKTDTPRQMLSSVHPTPTSENTQVPLTQGSFLRESSTVKNLLKIGRENREGRSVINTITEKLGLRDIAFLNKDVAHEGHGMGSRPSSQTISLLQKKVAAQSAATAENANNKATNHLVQTSLGIQPSGAKPCVITLHVPPGISNFLPTTTVTTSVAASASTQMPASFRAPDVSTGLLTDVRTLGASTVSPAVVWAPVGRTTSPRAPGLITKSSPFAGTSWANIACTPTDRTPGLNSTFGTQVFNPSTTSTVGQTRFGTVIPNLQRQSAQGNMPFRAIPCDKDGRVQIQFQCPEESNYRSIQLKHSPQLPVHPVPAPATNSTLTPPSVTVKKPVITVHLKPRTQSPAPGSDGVLSASNYSISIENNNSNESYAVTETVKRVLPGTSEIYRTPGACNKNKSGNVKRPMNAFMVWARHYRPILAQEFLNDTNSQISIKLGQTWNTMTSEEKEPFFQEADRIKAKHREENPDWVYRPQVKKKPLAIWHRVNYSTLAPESGDGEPRSPTLHPYSYLVPVTGSPQTVISPVQTSSPVTASSSSPILKGRPPSISLRTDGTLSPRFVPIAPHPTLSDDPNTTVQSTASNNTTQPKQPFTWLTTEAKPGTTEINVTTPDARHLENTQSETDNENALVKATGQIALTGNGDGLNTNVSNSICEEPSSAETQTVPEVVEEVTICTETEPETQPGVNTDTCENTDILDEKSSSEQHTCLTTSARPPKKSKKTKKMKKNSTKKCTQEGPSDGQKVTDTDSEANREQLTTTDTHSSSTFTEHSVEWKPLKCKKKKTKTFEKCSGDDTTKIKPECCKSHPATGTKISSPCQSSASFKNDKATESDKKAEFMKVPVKPKPLKSTRTPPHVSEHLLAVQAHHSNRLTAEGARSGYWRFPFSPYPYDEEIKERATRANMASQPFPPVFDLEDDEMEFYGDILKEDLEDYVDPYDPFYFEFERDDIVQPAIQAPELEMSRWVNYMNEKDSPSNYDKEDTTRFSAFYKVNNSSGGAVLDGKDAHCLLPRMQFAGKLQEETDTSCLCDCCVNGASKPCTCEGGRTFTASMASSSRGSSFPPSEITHN